MSPKGAPRSCSKCLYVHPPPTGANCKLDLDKLTMAQQHALQNAADDELGRGSGDEMFDLTDVRRAIDAQRGETVALKDEVSGLRDTIDDIVRGMNTLLANIPGQGVGGGAVPGAVPGAAPGAGAGLVGGAMLGGGLPPPLHVSDSDSSSSSDSDGSHRHRHHRHRRGKKVYAIKKFLPLRVKKPTNFPQLMSALCRLQAHHVREGTPNVDNMALHLQFLSDRASSNVHDLSYLILYDEAVRANAECYGMAAFSYGDGQLINRYLGMDSLTPGGASGSDAGKRNRNKNKKKSKRKEGDNSPCWYYNYGTCTAQNCEKPHVCYLCQAPDHKQNICGNVR